MWKDTLQIGQKKFTALQKYKIEELNGEQIVGKVYEKKKLPKTNQTKFRVENIKLKKGKKLYVKWKNYDNLLNSWISKKDVTT